MHQKHNSDHFRDALLLFALCCYTSWTLYSDADDVVIERLSEMEKGEWGRVGRNHWWMEPRMDSWTARQEKWNGESCYFERKAKYLGN